MSSLAPPSSIGTTPAKEDERTMSGKQITAGKRRPKQAQVRYPRQRVARPQARRSRSPLVLFLGAVAVAALLAGALVVASQLGRGGGNAQPPVTLVGAKEVQQLFAGIPQSGVTLGRPDAPVTLVEYADVQCPYCGQWARDVLPTVVADYVRPGKVRLVFRGLAFIGPESDTGARAAVAAGAQGKLWNALDLLYRNQGPENGGWITDDFLRSVAVGVPGLDADRVLQERTSPAVERELATARAAANAAAVSATPAFELGPTNGTLARLDVKSLDADFFRTALDGALG
jgi:protein-disulfide isomerase